MMMETEGKTYHDVCGVILAGGKSRRMGKDKATLMFRGMRMFDRTLGMMRELFDKIIIAGDRPDLCLPTVPCYPDIYPGSALGGLYTGLKESGAEWIMVSACDMPFPDADVARKLLELRGNNDAVVPQTPGGFEPLFSVYRKTCLPHMKELLERGNYKINDFYPGVTVRYAHFSELPDGWDKSLLNVNTPEQIRSVMENSR